MSQNNQNQNNQNNQNQNNRKEVKSIEAPLSDNYEKAQAYFANAASNAAIQKPSETRVCDLRLTRKSINALERNGIFTVGELLLYSKEDLLEMPSIGKKCISNICEALEQNNLVLPNRGDVI